MGYDEAAYLQIAGLQHFAFCPRQWALIHIEGQWAENLRTIEGAILHERAHETGFAEKRRDQLAVHALAVSSATLGVSGQCDVVEFQQTPGGVPLFGRPGLWQPVPVEYKRGAAKASDADRLQLCCQAMCLEEMLACQIPRGYLYYGQTKKREEVPLEDGLRRRVVELLEEMHQLFARRHTPRVKPQKHCKACSLASLCLPGLERAGSADAYFKKRIGEEEP